jgi:hypothetical protein
MAAASCPALAETTPRLCMMGAGRDTLASAGLEHVAFLVPAKGCAEARDAQAVFPRQSMIPRKQTIYLTENHRSIDAGQRITPPVFSFDT